VQGNLITFQHKYIHRAHVRMLSRNYISLLFVLHKISGSGWVNYSGTCCQCIWL